MTVNVNPTDAGDITSEQFATNPKTYPASYSCSGSYTLLAVSDPVSGYRFDRWEGGLSGNANPATITPAKAIIVTANFVEDKDDDGDGITVSEGDCNDNDASIYPEAIEICGDGIDQDCDGKDEECIDPPSSPTGVAASDGTLSDKVQVTWNPSTVADSYDVYRADMPAWTGIPPKRIAASVPGLSFTDKSAVPGNRYYYWVKARNSGGISKYSNFDAGYCGSKGSIPALPTDVSASDGTVSDKVHITWRASENTLIYEIWRADIPAFLGGDIKKIGSSSTASYSDASVTNGKQYYYWIKARNSWGVSRYSIFDSGYIGTASSPLPAPSTVFATDCSASGKVTVRWGSVSGAVVYEIWRAMKLVSEGGKLQRVGISKDTSFIDISGTAGATYYYWVKSRDSWGSSKYSHYNKGTGTRSQFENNGDGTVTEMKSGLMWSAEALTIAPWAYAFEYCESLTHAGYPDWRVPNIEELCTLIDTRNHPTAVDALYPYILGFNYWSASSNVNDADLAWAVHFGNSEVSNEHNKQAFHPIIAVRGGRP